MKRSSPSASIPWFAASASADPTTLPFYHVAISLVCAVVLVLVVELLNTAIEKLADRLTTDHDPQIGRVKDIGSAAVGVALVMAGLFWLFAIAERMGAI